MAAYGAAASLRKTLSQLINNPEMRDHLLPFLEDNRDVERESKIQIRDAEAEDVINSHMPWAHFVSPSEADNSNQHIRALDRRVYSLKCFLDGNRDVNREFEIRIRDAIYQAEDVIDSHLAHFISPAEAEISNQSFSSELEKLIQSINSIVESTKSEEFDHPKINDSVWKTSDEITIAKWHPVTGRMEELLQLIDRLLGESEELGLVSIVGIAGMGKSTLAATLRLYIRSLGLFDVCGWCKVPIEYKKRDVLLELLVSMNNRSDEIHQMTDDQLAKHFYNFLKNKKYLVFLDNVRDIVVWNDLKEFFPNHYNGSRILITTRDEVIAGIADSPYQLGPLTNEDTLDLFQQIVFREEPCPHELLVTKKDIAESCRGLPLAVVIVGRLLRSANLSREYWELVLSSIVTCDGYENLVEAMVSLTYNHLPHNLRACLLYMSMFPYEYVFPAFKLMHLWNAEGFLTMDFEYTDSMSEMGTAMNYMSELERRGLLYIRTSSEADGVVLNCRLANEVIHDFSLRTAKEENFSFIINKDTKYGSFLQKEDGSDNRLRRLFIYKSIIPLIIQDFPEHRNLPASFSTVRSLLYYGPEHQYPLRPWLELNLLKVLDILKIRFYSFPPEILKLLQLRYLSLSYNGQLPAEVCRLHNLQFLIVSRYLSVKCSGAPSYLPMEIWNMKKLTHLQVMGSDIPLNTDLILENLFSLLDVSAHSCSRQILEKLPNLLQLGVRIESLPEDESLSVFSHLNILDRLFSFRCVVMHPNIGSEVVPCTIPAFPSTLRELTLSGCGLPWAYMRAIAALPNLVCLQLQNYAFRGPVWEVKKDEFPLLGTLWLEDANLEDWILADESCFPKMTQLVMKHCYKLHKIPDANGYFPKLENIQVVNCSTSALESIQAKKQNLRSRDDKVVLYSPQDD